MSGNRCRFGHAHRWAFPIYRNGKLAAPHEEWAECDRCGAIEDEHGQRRTAAELTVTR